MAAKKKQEVVVQPAHPDLKWLEDPAGEVGGVQQTKSAAPAGPSVDDLMKQIAELRSQVDNTRQTNMALMAQPIVSMPPQVQTEIDYKALPDPVAEPENYARKLNEQVQLVIKGQKAIEDYNSGLQQTEQERVSTLWSDFSGKYTGHAEHPQLAQAAALTVAQKAKARGIDVNKYMYANSPQFMAEVAAEMDRVAGRSLSAEAEDDDEPTTMTKPGGVPRAEADDHRTGGMFGGTEVGGRPDVQRRDPDMFDEVREWQRKTGFMR